LKRFLTVLLTFALTLTPMWALAEVVTPTDAPDDSFQIAGDIDSPEIWILPENGGLTWDDTSMTIALPEDATTGYAWTVELDDETVLTQETDSVGPAQDGALSVHTYVYKPSADGVALVSLYYEQQDGDDVSAMLSYTATVSGGKITDVAYEDLSDWGAEGDDAGGVLYEGESGGVALYLPEGMSVVNEENGVTRLENEDKSIWVTIQYDPEGDAEALLAEFEDEAGLTKQYSDESAGSSFLSTTVDRESDPPRGILVYEVVKDGIDTIIEHTGYEAPNGGVLIVDTGYLMQ
jgi:predicted secreted protein